MIKVSCQCGKVQGEARNLSPASTVHVTCCCRYCQEYAKYLGQESRLLDDMGGTDIVMMSPKSFVIQAGMDQVACLRMTPSGPQRWYAKCCNSPIANTLSNLRIPFMSVAGDVLKTADPSQSLDSIIGPVKAVVYGDFKDGSEPKKAGLFSRSTMLLGFITRLAIWFAKGDGKNSPFLDPLTTKPITLPILVPQNKD